MSRNTSLAIVLLALAASPAALAQDTMTPTTTVDPATRTTPETPETPVDPAQDATPQTPIDPAQQPQVDPAQRPSVHPTARPTPTTPTTPMTPTSPTAPPAGPETTIVTRGGQEVRVRSQSPGPIVGEYRIDFATLDGDGDGHISRSEAGANEHLEAEFDAVDRNRDGRLSQEELSGW